MKRLIQSLISLFKTGGKTKNGTLIFKDLVYANQLKTIVNWQHTNPALYKTWLTFPKEQQVTLLRQLKQVQITLPQLEAQIRQYGNYVAPAAIKFIVKHGIKFAENELSAIDRVSEQLANMINNKENLIKYPEGFNMTMQTLFTVRSSGATTSPMQILRDPSGQRRPMSGKKGFPEGEAFRSAKIKVHVVPYEYAKKIYPGIKKTTRGWDPGTKGSTDFYLVWEQFSSDALKTWSAQLADIKKVITHEIAHIKDPSVVVSPKLNSKYDSNAPYVGDTKIALSKKAAPNWKKNYYYHQFEVAANLAPVLAKITNNTKNILRHAGKKRTLAALNQLLKWSASGTNTSFRSWSKLPGNFTDKLDTTATYILTGNLIDMFGSVEMFFHEFKIENPVEHRKVINKLARQLESLKQQVIDTRHLTPESIIKLKTLI